MKKKSKKPTIHQIIQEGYKKSVRKPTKKKPKKSKTKSNEFGAGLSIRQIYLRERASAAHERAMMASTLKEIWSAIRHLENMQLRITEVTSAVVNDLHRRPLQIADINPRVFQAAVDKVAHTNPKAFCD